LGFKKNREVGQAETEKAESDRRIHRRLKSPSRFRTVVIQKRGVEHPAGLDSDELINSDGKNLEKSGEVINKAVRKL